MQGSVSNSLSRSTLTTAIAFAARWHSGLHVAADVTHRVVLLPLSSRYHAARISATAHGSRSWVLCGRPTMRPSFTCQRSLRSPLRGAGAAMRLAVNTKRLRSRREDEGAILFCTGRFDTLRSPLDRQISNPGRLERRRYVETKVRCLIRLVISSYPTARTATPRSQSVSGRRQQRSG